MTLNTTCYNVELDKVGKIEFSPDQIKKGKFNGEVKIDPPDQSTGQYTYSVEDSQHILIAPFDLDFSSPDEKAKIDIRITGPDPYVVFQSEQSASNGYLIEQRFNFAELSAIKLCMQFLKDGLSKSIVSDIYDMYDSNRSPFHGFIQDAKCVLPFNAYTDLLSSCCTKDETVNHDLLNSRHNFVKNLIRGKNAGNQYPIRDYAQFQSRILSYESSDQLKSLDRSLIVERLIDDASEPDLHIDDICNFEKIFVEFANDIKTGYFVNLLKESILSKLDVNTVTKSFDNEFQLDSQRLVSKRFSGQKESRTYKQVKEQAYDTHKIDDWCRALATVEKSDTTRYHQALADLLYWYTEQTNVIPDAIKPEIYATAEALYESAGNSFMSDAAGYQAGLSEGVFQRKIGNYENALSEFVRCKSLCDDKESPPFDPVQPFIESILTDIDKYLDQAEFIRALEIAEYGKDELTDGKYEHIDTETEETLLQGWIEDLSAQNKVSNGQLDDAIEPTNTAIAYFSEVGEEGASRTARARRYQIQALEAQLKLDFKEAANHHSRAADESPSGKTKKRHHDEADLCQVKSHLSNENVTKALSQLDELNIREPTVNNLALLSEVFSDYLSDSITQTDRLIKDLDLTRADNIEMGRHISYHGDYISAAILITASQRFKQQNLSKSVLDHIVRIAVKSAISGGLTQEWTETTELSQIDAENIWRQLIPDVILDDIEYVEELAGKATENYAAQGMKILAALEGYLRVIIEYYAKLEYSENWEEEVTEKNGITLGNIYEFFQSDDASDRIRSSREIENELNQMRYFGADSDIKDVRNDLDHNDLSWLDKESFEKLMNKISQIMRWSVNDCPIIARIDDVTERHNIYFASAKLQRHRLPRRVEISTEAKLESDKLYYIPPRTEIESGMAQVDSDSIIRCELNPEKQTTNTND